MDITDATTISPTTEDEIKATKALRVQIDACIQAAKALRKTRETSLVVTKLQEARMWAGQNLQELGAPHPYPNGNNPENAIVDPPADRA